MEVGVDAYVSVDFVTDYLTARGAEASWVAAGDKQEAAIIEATSFLDAAFSWVGRIADYSQSLAWPRVCAHDREGRLLEDIPVPVQNACAELANLALGGRLMPMSLATGGAGIKTERIGDVEFDYDPGIYVPTYEYVQALLRGIGGMRTGSSGISRLVRA
jgi:hypothetical protein